MPRFRWWVSELFTANDTASLQRAIPLARCDGLDASQRRIVRRTVVLAQVAAQNGRYSSRKASIGWRREARRAGA